MHLYFRNGDPCYEVPYTGSKEGMRDSTLADARKLGLVPSVTEIIKIKAAPGLTNWLVETGMLAALTLPRAVGETLDEFLARARADAKEQAKKAAAKGTEIHDALDAYLSGRPVKAEYADLAKDVGEAVKAYFNCDDFVCEQSFAHTKGYGGKVDLHSPSLGIVADFKTKDKFRSKKLAYDEHCMQLAAYARGLKMDIESVRLCNIFVSWSGSIVFHDWTREEARRGLQMFDACLELWKLDKQFDPSFDAEDVEQ